MPIISHCEISNYVDKLAGSGPCVAGVVMSILPYADDIVLISYSPQGLQRYLNVLKSLVMD